ncbi:MAG TPA: oxidoreductase [Spirochaetia bacterium]|nr:oxidoreductase [Spirochaetia bacterium]
MIRTIDALLNRLTMYRLTLYYLMALLGLGLALSFFHLVSPAPLAILSTTAVLLAACYAANWAAARLLRIPSNPESSLITALILALIVGPVSFMEDPGRVGLLALAGVASVASKYILAFRRQHAFNPAAVGALVAGVVLGLDVTWWVGSLPMLPLVAIGGLLLAWRVHRMRFVAVFLGAFLVFLLGMGLAQGLTPDLALTTLKLVFGQSALVFFAVVMLTEPMTSPKRFPLQILYAALVAFLYQPQLSVLGQNLTPEEALLVGNLFSFLVSPSRKLKLALKERREIGKGIMSFSFPQPAGFRHRLGQYMEWTLPIKNGDSRGSRRYFSIASSPTEPELLIAARFYPRSSRYKEELARMGTGAVVLAGELGGDFVLPRDPMKPLVFIAGGIGITPFRSMLKYLVDTGQRRDIVLLYSNNTEEEIVFRDVLCDAERATGLKVVYTLTDQDKVPPDWPGRIGLIDAGMLREEVPGLASREVFVSGSPGMVRAMTGVLRSAGVARANLRTDAFSGYSG